VRSDLRHLRLNSIELLAIKLLLPGRARLKPLVSLHNLYNRCDHPTCGFKEGALRHRLFCTFGNRGSRRGLSIRRFFECSALPDGSSRSFRICGRYSTWVEYLHIAEVDKGARKRESRTSRRMNLVSYWLKQAILQNDLLYLLCVWVTFACN